MEIEIKEPIELCDIKCKLDLLTRTDGSVLLSQGDTAIIVGCYGPVEAKLQKMFIDKANVEVHYRPKAGLPGVGDRFQETIIRNICQTSLAASLYPRTAVVIVVQELQNFGSLISCAVNGVCLALLNSGIDMRFLVAAVTCGLQKNGDFHINPGILELENAKAVFVFVFDSIEAQIIASHTTGTFSVSQFKNALQLSKKASAEIFDYYKSVMKRKLKL